MTPVLQKEDTNTDIQMSPAAISNLQYIIPRPVLEEGQISNTDSLMSPATIPIPKQRYPTKNTQHDQEINEPARFCIQLHENNFCNIRWLPKFQPLKRRKMIAKAMLVGLGLYDPSDEFLANYKNDVILEIYKTLTERNLDKNNLY